MGETSTVLPVTRFVPAPGLVIDRTDKSITIDGTMELYGPEATPERAASVQTWINSHWSRQFSDGYMVVCQVTVRFRSANSRAGQVTQIEAAKTAGPSHVSPGPFGRSMTLNANEVDAFTWTPVHEFGHIIGLQDRYNEGILSKVRSLWGGTRNTSIEPGYEGNLMAETGGALGSQNLADLASENNPSPYWINDDDQVAAWVKAHSVAEVGKLSTANKIKAIKTLQGGWVSSDDIGAICKICSSVGTRNEANAIRNNVILRDFSDIGQRTTVRIAFSNMP